MKTFHVLTLRESHITIEAESHCLTDSTLCFVTGGRVTACFLLSAILGFREV